MVFNYTGLSAEEFETISKRYKIFQDTCNDTSKPPVKVFSPLSKKRLDELVLIREVSKDLQMKKEEDVKKAAQIAEQQAEEEEQKTEKTSDEEEKKAE